MNKPIRIAVTGAAGAISYSLLFRIASGQLLGEKQPISLKLIEIPGAMKPLDGVVMEIIDCAFPCLESIDECINDYSHARQKVYNFQNKSYATNWDTISSEFIKKI